MNAERFTGSRAGEGARRGRGGRGSVGIEKSRAQRRLRKLARASLAILLVTGGVAVAAPPADSLVLEGDYIRTGVSANGTLGVGGSVSPGFIFDPTGTGTFNPANDYLTPGTPHEGFSVSYTGGGLLLNNNANSSFAAIGSLVAPVVDPGSAADQSAVWSGTHDGAFTIQHAYELDEDSRRVKITTTITALADLDELKFARWIDPDSGGTSSINTRGNLGLSIAPEDWVNSVSESTGATLGLFTDSGVLHDTGISPGWSTDPNFYIDGSADSVGDHTIGLGFDVGYLRAGQSIDLTYWYAVAAHPDDFAVLVSGGRWLGGTDADWATASNWNPSGAPVSGDFVRIESGVGGSINHNVLGNEYSGWTFTTGSQGMTITGNAVSIGASGSISNRSAFHQTFDAPILAGGNLMISGGDAGMTFSDIAIANGSTLTFSSGDSHDNVVRGVISGGTGMLVKAGSGTLLLTGANTYGGGTIISRGTLVASTASLPGSVLNRGTLQFDQNTDGTFSGDIDGTGALRKTGSGTVTMTGSNTYSGGTSVEAGGLVGTVGSGGTAGSLSGTVSDSSTPVFSISNGATLTLDQGVGQTGIVAGNISGAGALVKSGAGHLNIYGSIDASNGGIAVEGGSLVINGLVNGATVVHSGGRLGGIGTYGGGLHVESGGTVAPGNSIGTINTHNYTQDAGSTLVIEIDHLGNSDRIADTGTTTINGGTVVVTPDATADVTQFVAGTEYTFLTSANPIVGAGFEGLTVSGGTMPLARLIRGTNDYRIMLTTFEQISATYNQAQLGAWLDSGYAGAELDAGLLAVIGEIGGMGVTPTMLAAMDQMNGEIYATLGIANVQLMDNYYARLSQRLRSQSARESSGQGRDRDAWTGMIFGHGIGGDGQSDGNARGFSLATGGTTVMLERALAPYTDLGLVFDYASAQIDLDGSADASSFDSYRWGTYLTHDLGAGLMGGYWTAAAHLGHDDYRTRRHIAIGAMSARSEADHEGWQGGAYVERGWNVPVMGDVRLQPFVALQYLHHDQDGVVEHGAGSLDVMAGGTDLDSLRTRLGAALDLLAFERGMVSFHGVWNHELLSETTAVVDSRLAGSAAGTPFAVRGVDLGRDWVTLGPYLNAWVGGNAELYAAYDLSFNEHQALHTGGGGVSLYW